MILQTFFLSFVNSVIMYGSIYLFSSLIIDLYITNQSLLLSFLPSFNSYSTLF